MVRHLPRLACQFLEVAPQLMRLLHVLAQCHVQRAGAAAEESAPPQRIERVEMRPQRGNHALAGFSNAAVISGCWFIGLHLTYHIWRESRQGRRIQAYLAAGPEASPPVPTGFIFLEASTVVSTDKIYIGRNLLLPDASQLLTAREQQTHNQTLCSWFSTQLPDKFIATQRRKSQIKEHKIGNNV
jgi:hypothetical protein